MVFGVTERNVSFDAAGIEGAQGARWLVMTTNDLPALSADAIRSAFLAEAEADTQMVLRVAEQLASFQAAKAALEAAHGELVTLLDEAHKRPGVAAKLTELGVPGAGSLAVTVGGKGSRGSRGRSSSRRASKRPSKSVSSKTSDTSAVSGDVAPSS